MNGKQIFNLIPPILYKSAHLEEVSENIRVALFRRFAQSSSSSIFSNSLLSLASDHKVGIFTGELAVDQELYSNSDWIILLINNDKLYLRNANTSPGTECNVYVCDITFTGLKVTCIERELFYPRNGIETIFSNLEFGKRSSLFGSNVNKETEDFLAKLKTECKSLQDSTWNMLKEWKEYVSYDKRSIDLVDRCRISLDSKKNGDIYVWFLKDLRFYDEFDKESGKYLEFEISKFNKALADRTLEFFVADIKSTYRLLRFSGAEEGDALVPLISKGRAVGVIIRQAKSSRMDLDKLIYAYESGDDIICSLIDHGKKSQIERFEKCLTSLSACDNKESIRVLRWLMEYANNCGRALDKKYWEDITEFKNTNLNQEQKDAVRLILNTTDVGFIMGPPGTGKTSVIAEAIYQLARKGKTILLSSQSNDAIDNALDRLKANPDIRAVRLVSREDYPDKTFDRRYFAWNMVSSLDEDIKESIGKIDGFVARYEKIPALSPQIVAYRKYIYELINSNLAGDLPAFKAKVLNDFPWKLKDPFHEFLYKTICIICNRSDFMPYSEYIIKLHLIACKYRGIPTMQADWITRGVDEIKEWYKIPGRNDEVLQRQKDIRTAFLDIRKKLAEAPFDAESDAETMERAYNEKFYAELVRTANVYGITCNANNDRLVDGLVHGKVQYDYVIIDEVSKATTLELLAPMLKAPKCILIGDHHQLPPVFLADDDLKENEELCYKYQDLITNTFFKNYFDAAPEAAKCVLKKQYRMHSEISDIAVSNFYKENETKVILENGLDKNTEERIKQHGLSVKGRGGKALVVPERHLYWVDSTPYDGNGELAKDTALYEDRKNTTSCANQYEIDGILMLLERLEHAQEEKEGCRADISDNSEQNGAHKLEVGIITFYSLQNKMLKKAIDKAAANFPHLTINVNTVDKFQGQEREVIIVSLVRSKKGKINSGNEFFRKYERINVAFSRAQKLLFIVGSERFCEVQSVPIDYISLTGREAERETRDVTENEIIPETEAISGEEFIYKNIISKLKSNECFFNISELLQEE